MFLVYIGLCFVECGCAEEIQPESIEKDKKMKTTIAKGCLYCGLRLPEQAEFCPECGRPVEVVIRVDSEVKKMKTTIAKGCLYCGLWLPEQAEFCPECGRPIERGSIPHTTQEPEVDCPDMESEGKDDLERQDEASSACSDPLTHEATRMGDEHVNPMHTLMMLARGNG
jgi:RNA polymerase subunit RPABC4/transcription elongation factor Spt4